MSFFDINNIFFTVLSYSMSYLEFFSVMAGLVAVWLSAKANIWSWPIGVVNVSLSFFFYYQIQLYPDMFLQIFFFVTNLIGWWRWTHPKPEEEDNKLELKVSFMKLKQFILLFVAGVAGTFKSASWPAIFMIGFRICLICPARIRMLIPSFW